MRNCLCFWLSMVWLCLPVAGQTPPESIDFEQHIRPLLAEHCYECHSEQSKPLQGGLRLDSPDWIMAGGDSGPSLLSSKPDESLILQAIRYKDPSTAMPPSANFPTKWSTSSKLGSEAVRRCPSRSKRRKFKSQSISKLEERTGRFFRLSCCVANFSI